MDLPLYEQQLRDVERNIENLLDAIQQGIFTKSTKGRLDELEATKEELEIRIANEKIAKPKLTEEKIKHFLYRFRVLDMSKEKHRRMLIDMFINRIYLYDDKLVITFNHKDGAETITLEDIETALAEAGFGSDLVSFAVPENPDTHSGVWIFCYFQKEGLEGPKWACCKTHVLQQASFLSATMRNMTFRFAGNVDFPFLGMTKAALRILTAVWFLFVYAAC